MRQKMPRKWTSEQKARQAALIQLWKPWDKSTGAKTDKGKAIVSMNACKGYLRPRRRLTRKQSRGCFNSMAYLSKSFDVFMNLCAQNRSSEYFEVEHPVIIQSFYAHMAVIDNAEIAYQRLKRKAQRLKRKEAKRGRVKSLVRPF
jgi:hypothetical protein